MPNLSPENKSIEDSIISQEGGYVNDPSDKGGETFEGLSKVNNPKAWANGRPTDAQVRSIFETKYLYGPKLDQILDAQLRRQMVDFAYCSGPIIAIQKLQGVLQVPVDGVLGPETILALSKVHPEDIGNHLVAARIRMIIKFVQANPSQLKFAGGWCERALQFLS